MINCADALYAGVLGPCLIHQGHINYIFLCYIYQFYTKSDTLPYRVNPTPLHAIR